MDSSPRDGGRKPAIRCSRVDLPAPFGPSSPVTPGPMVIVMSLTATTLPYQRDTLRSSMVVMRCPPLASGAPPAAPFPLHCAAFPRRSFLAPQSRRHRAPSARSRSLLPGDRVRVPEVPLRDGLTGLHAGLLEGAQQLGQLGRQELRVGVLEAGAQPADR